MNLEKNRKPLVERDEVRAGIRGRPGAIWVLLLCGVVGLFIAWAANRRPADVAGPSEPSRAVVRDIEAHSTIPIAIRNAGALARPGTDADEGGTPSSETAVDELTDRQLDEPITAEQNGVFQDAFAQWQGEKEDTAATEDARALFRTAFAELGIRPEAQYIRCGDALCRARFRYKELKDLYRMREIDEPDGIRIATTMPEHEGDLYTVSIYWTRNPNPEGLLTDTLGH